MSISGSLLGYENNNEIGCGVGSGNKKKNSITSRSLLQHCSSKSSAMGKHCPPSLNSSITNSVITTTSSTASHHHHHHHQQQQQQQQHQHNQHQHQQHLMNAKRKHVKYNNMHPDLDNTNNLHLNSLWSIWYGVLLTLFQGYLAVHGAYRFLGCSLIQWKIEPVAELNLQIVLSGVVFILLPLFFTSAVFKVGNLANDGIKLATGSKQQRCSMAPHDGLEEEAGGGTLRALWTHGGPTAAFVHIVIAMCLLLPRLLLEARIIENGLLPRENIWQTELDFITISRRNLVVMSVVNAPYQNTSNIDDEDYYNDTMFTAIASSSYSNNNNLIDINNVKPEKPMKTAKKPVFVGVGFTSGESVEDNYDERKDVGRNESGYGEQVSIEDMEATEFQATQMPHNNGMATSSTNQPSLTTALMQKNLDETFFKSSAQPKSNSLDGNNEVVATVKTATTTVQLTTTSAGTSTQMTGLAKATEQMTTQTSPMTIATTTTTTTTTTTMATTTAASSFTSTNRETDSAETTETTSSIATTTKAAHSHHHHHHQHHHSGKSHRKHSNRQHRHRSQNHRRHFAEARPTLTDEYARNFDERTTKPIDFNSLDDITASTGGIGGKATQRLGIDASASYEDIDYGRRGAHNNAKTTSTISTTTRDSAIHIVKPEMLPEIIPSTPVATNSKIIEIKTNERSRKVKRMADEEMQVEIEPEYLVGDAASNESDVEQLNATPTDFRMSATGAGAAANINAASTNDNGLVRLDGFSGMLQIFFGIEKPIDVTVFAQPPSAEFMNLLFALLVWSVRYPAVFWSTTKPFATIFSVQIIAAALDIIFSYVGVSNLYKLEVYSEAMPVQNTGLILNGVVTLSLFLLSTILLLASSMIMYLYGHGRLAAKMRDRSLITMKTSETWIYFAHCASLCYVLALAVVKAPLLNDLSATYRSNLHCTTFLSALVSVAHILLWIVIWLGLTAKRRWTFKLPPLDTFGIAKASTQPLLMPNRGNLPSGGGAIMEQKSVMSTASSTDGVVEDIYWPKLTPSSPKLKVTFNEVTSTSDDVHLIGDQEQNDGKRNSPRGTAVCFTSVTGEIDDGDYATLRSATATTVIGIGIGGAAGGGVAHRTGNTTGESTTSGSLVVGSSVKILHLSEYDELPPPPPPALTTSSNCVGVSAGGAVASVVGIGGGNTSSDYANCSIVDDNTSEEGKLLACVRDDSVTYASTRDLEPTPPLPPPPPPKPLPHANDNAITPPRPIGMAPQAMPENMQLSSSPEHLVSPLAPVTVTVHTNEAHISSSSTPRCLRRADSGVPNEALTPRSDSESTTSPPERAPSESSSGVHSGEERDIEVVIRPRAAIKPPPKPPQPPIQEEPYGRSTNMKMSSFINNADIGLGRGSNSATLPLTRTVPEQKFDYSHCSTMPLPAGCHSSQHYANGGGGSGGGGGGGGGGYSSSSSMHHSHYAQYKPQVGNYANSAVAMAGANAAKQQLQLQQQQQQQLPQVIHHTTLPNGVRYSTPHFLRRLPHVTMSAAESPYGHLGLGAGHHTFSKLIHDPLQNSLANTTIPEDRDSANYSMSSDQDCNLYATASHLN